MKEIVFIVIYMAQLFCFGSLVANRYTVNKTSYFSIGFVAQIAMTELLGWWMVAFRKPFVLFEVLCILIMCAGVILAIKNRKSIKGSVNQAQDKTIRILTMLVLILIIVFVISRLFFYYRSDADDSFYVSNVLLFSKSSNLNMYDSSFGDKMLGTVPMYDFQIWESYLAVLCRLSSIVPAVMCHYIMPFVLLAVAISAIMLMGNVLLGNNVERNIFAVMLLLFYIMGGYAVYSKGSFLLSRLWQGKAVYLHIVLPVAIAYMLWHVDLQQKNKFLGLGLVFIMIAGIALNPTSMYVVGFQILFMVIAIAIYKKNLKICLHILPTLAIISVISFMILMRTKQFDGQIEAASEIPDRFAIQAFWGFLGEGKGYFYIYIICCIVILIIGDSKGKILCVGTPILLLLGVWNPVMAPVIAQHLTMVPSYWRVFWLLPIDYAIAYSAVLLFRKRRGYILAMIALVIGIFCSGKYMFTDVNHFIRVENKERIPQEVLNLGEIVDNNEDTQTVLACDMAATTLRQEYNNIKLVFSRYQYVLDLFKYRGNETEASDRIHMFEFVNNSDGLDGYENIQQLLQQYNVTWILIDESQQDKISYLAQIGYDIVGNEGKLVLLNTK